MHHLLSRFSFAVKIMFFFGMLLFCKTSFASENFIPGIYVNNTDGTQYIVSGTTTVNGRSMWTIVSAANSNKRFSGVWETGPAVGNSILAGNSNIVNNPDGYAPGRSYGVVGANNLSGWFSGNPLAAAQAGDTISISWLWSDGKTRDQFGLTLFSRLDPVTAVSEQYIPGIYRSQDGTAFIVSGAPSQTGRTTWTIMAQEDSPLRFNAIWETGPATGNSVLAGDFNEHKYFGGRSYGVVGANNLSGWFSGNPLAAAQAGDTISISWLWSDGQTRDQFVLVRDSSVSIMQGLGSSNFIPGCYRSASGKRYLVSGSETNTGRTYWTISSVSMPNIFNAVWETGPATGNSVLAGDFNEHKYFGGRSYGVVGANNLSGWFSGNPLAAAQAGDTISISWLWSDGKTRDQFVIKREPDSSGTVGQDTERFLPGSDYMDTTGRPYTVSGSGDIWTITGTGGTNFNSQWQTGPASLNSLPEIISNASRFPQGYLAGRSYGVVGANNLSGWFSGNPLAAVQAGNTISISWLWSNGRTRGQFVVIKGGSGGTGGVGKVAFGNDQSFVNKFSGKARIGVNRIDGGTGMVSVHYSTSDGTARANTDYVPVSNAMLAWGDGDTDTKYIEITIPDTATAGRSFTISLFNPVGGVEVGQLATATVTIFDRLTYFWGVEDIDMNDSRWLTSFYVAYWGRAGDPGGLNYWLGVVVRGETTVPGVAENFALSGEARAMYPYFNSPETATDAERTAFVQSVYQNMLNRNVPAHDEGVQYWVGELREGRMTPGRVIGDMIYAAIQIGGEDWLTIWNKVQVAEYFTQRFAASGRTWQDGDFDLARQALMGVTDDPGTVDAGKARVEQMFP